jgi:hypothetical protein
MPGIDEYKLDNYRLDGIDKSITEFYRPTITLSMNSLSIPQTPFSSPSTISETPVTSNITFNNLNMPNNPTHTPS